MASDNELAAILADYVPRSDYEEAIQALTELDDTHKTTSKELEDLRGTHTTAAKRLEELEAKTRGRAYQDTFREVSKGKVKEGMEDDVYQLLGIKHDADEPDPKAMEAALKAFLEKKPAYLAGEPAKKKLATGEERSRGSYAQPEEGTFSVTRAQMKDGAWTRQNGAKVAAASEAGLLQILE